jgi:hypothetical protein
VAGAYFHEVATVCEAIEGGVHVFAGYVAGAEFTNQLLEGGAGVWELGNVVEDRRIGHLPIIEAGWWGGPPGPHADALVGLLD